MKRTTLSSGLGFMALLAVALGIATAPAQAANIGILNPGDSYSDTISSNGPSFSQDYTFELTSSAGISVLASAQGQTSNDFGVDALTISLYDDASNLIASASGAPAVFFDSFSQSGIALGVGTYLFNIVGDVTAGKKAFVALSIAANQVTATPIPAAGLMLLTGLGALGGLAYRRRVSAGKSGTAAA